MWDLREAFQQRITESEFLGADLLLRCKVGDEVLTVRVDGQRHFQVGEALGPAGRPTPCTALIDMDCASRYQ